MLTVPAMFRTTFDHHAAVVLSALGRCGAPCLDDGSRPVKGKARKGGSSTVRHMHGRHGPYHPPRHLIAPSGGYDAQGARWEPLQDVPYERLRRQWPWHLWCLVRRTRKTEALHQWGDRGFRTSPTGLVTNGQQGKVPSPSQSLARDVAQDVVRPPIAVRRIDRSDGERVTSHDRSHRTERLAHDTVTVETCLGRMVPHTVPKGCKRIRDDGGQATKTFAKGKVAMQTALAKVEGVVQGAVQIIARCT